MWPPADLMAVLVCSFVCLLVLSLSWLVPLEVLALLLMVIWVGSVSSSGTPNWGPLAYTAMLVWDRLKTQPVFWATQVLVFVTSTLLTYTMAAWHTLFAPGLRHVMREQMKRGVAVREAHLTDLTRELGQGGASVTGVMGVAPRNGLSAGSDCMGSGMVPRPSATARDLREVEMTAARERQEVPAAAGVAQQARRRLSGQLNFLQDNPMDGRLSGQSENRKYGV